MNRDQIVQAIVEKCRIYYDDALISEETIIKQYLQFFAKQINTEERTSGFSFHTGSFCFDIAAVAAVAVGAFAYNLSGNDDILRSLNIDDMVLYKGERYRWGGIVPYSFSSTSPAIDYMVLHQDAKGKNGSSKSQIPYDRNKHLVKPYFGSSMKTDGRGIRKVSTNRNDFISYILQIPIEQVPTTLDVSVVIVADKNKFTDICNHLRIEYQDGKSVGLTDIVPVSYYTSSGESIQIGKNLAKAEAVIKVTGKISMARDLVLDKYGNKVIGLLVTESSGVTLNSAEMNDLLRRRTLKFVHFSSVYAFDSVSFAVDQYDESEMFACTKELLSSSEYSTTESQNKLTVELNRQISNIIHREMDSLFIEGVCSWETYKTVKEKIYQLRHSNWDDEDRDNFILSSVALLNLFTTSFFSMAVMEDAVKTERINHTVQSPEARLDELQKISEKHTNYQPICTEIIQALLTMYIEIFESNPKGKCLLNLLECNKDKKVALIVPKLYHAEIFREYFCTDECYDNVECTTTNRFDGTINYDIIITVGDIVGKKFDPIECFSASKIFTMLYEAETKLFRHRQKKHSKSERKLNAKIKGLKGDDYIQAVSTDDNDDLIPEETVAEFADVDEYIEAMGAFDVRKLVSLGTNTGACSMQSEVKHIGTFTTGERILFSKYYSAVVFDQEKGVISEKAPEKLLSGDILVFTKRDDYTKNIVDMIFDQLLKLHRLSDRVQDAAVKAFYWKEALRDYKEKNDLTYTAVARQLSKLGSTLQEVTVRQWLIPESHIVGPRDEKIMEIIAKLTQDQELLADPNGFFEACREIRHYRREILKLIAQAINDKLSNREPTAGSAFEIVFENVDKLAETMKLDDISELDSAVNINSNLVNRPIMETEVMM